MSQLENQQKLEQNVLELNQQKEAIQNVNELNFLTGNAAQQKAQGNELLELNVNSSFSLQQEEIYSDANVELIVGKIANAMNSTANLNFKGSTFLEPSEVEDLKRILDEEICDSNIKIQFKRELTNFQEKIKTDYIQQVNDLKEEKLFCESQIDMLDVAKKKIVMDRLAKMCWPYDEKTRAYDRKIEALGIQVKKIDMKIEKIMSMRPAAKEKDILIFQHQLKQKFTQ